MPEPETDNSLLKRLEAAEVEIAALKERVSDLETKSIESAALAKKVAKMWGVS